MLFKHVKTKSGLELRQTVDPSVFVEVYINQRHSLFQTHAGGGSGGSVWVQCEMFVLTGHIYCNGGNGASNGGGGAGGRINVFFETGTYETGHVEAKGLSSGYFFTTPTFLYI